jgi:Uma2 family endonuclease
MARTTTLLRAHDLPSFRTGDCPLPAQGEWTYEDYLRLPDDGWRYEVLKGVLHMTAAPAPRHQAALRNLTVGIVRYLESNPLGQVYFAPIDVFLPGALATPCQPDLFFLSNERLGLVSERGIEGAPDLIAEVLSPSNWLDDRRTKFEIYAEAGVREYWLLDPKEKTMEVFSLENGAYALLGKFVPGERACSRILTGFAPAVAEIFAA